MNVTRGIAVYAAVLSTALALGWGAAEANAQPAPVGPGDTIGSCTVGATGHYQGKTVALTAAHCIPTLLGTGSSGLGTIAGVGYDWTLVELPAGTPIHNTLPTGATLDQIGGEVPGGVCKYGRMTQETCADTYRNLAVIQGDSGGAVYQGNTLIGLVSNVFDYSRLPGGFTLG
jgi:hypothetical protein